MRIAIFSDTASPQKNGVAQSIERQVTILRAHGHSTFVVGPSDFEVEEKIKDCSILPTRDHRYALRLPIRPNKDFGRLPEFDVAHIHTPFTYGLLGIMEARRRRAPCIYTHHTDFDHYLSYVPVASSALGKKAYRYAYRLFLSKPQALICPSNNSMRKVRNLMRGRHQPITTTLNTPAFGVSNEDCILKGIRSYDVCCVGRLSEEKNISLMADVLKRVLRSRPRTKIAIIGDGKDRDAFNMMFCDDERRQTTFMGELSHAEVVSTLARSRIYFQPSVSETQGLVVQEAWSVGTPVVLADSPTAREFLTVGKNGWKAPASPYGLSALLLSVLTNGLDGLDDIRENCMSSIGSFSPDIWYKHYGHILDRVST